LRLFSFGGYGLALAALALVVFGADDSYPLLAVSRFAEALIGFLIVLFDRLWLDYDVLL